MEKKDEPPVGLDMMGEPIIDPAPDKPPTWEDSPAGKALFKGGTLGMAAGLAFVTYTNSSSIGFFVGDVVFVAVGLGFIVGAVLGWLSVKVTGKDNVPPATTWWG